jgi:hypothetical protein
LNFISNFLIKKSISPITNYLHLFQLNWTWNSSELKNMHLQKVIWTEFKFLHQLNYYANPGFLIVNHLYLLYLNWIWNWNCNTLKNMYLHGVIWKPFKILQQLKLYVNYAFQSINHIYLLHLNRLRNCYELKNMFCIEWFGGIIVSKFSSFLVRFCICEFFSRFSFILIWSIQILNSWNVHWRYHWLISDSLFW